MKQKVLQFKAGFHGLQAHFLWSLLASAVLCIVLFCGLYFTMDYFLSEYFEQSDFEEQHIRRQGKSLQDFINENNISSRDVQKIKKWERRQPVILLELYSGDTCIYSSVHEMSDTPEYEINWSDVGNHVNVQLADEEVQAVLYSDFTYQYYLWGTVLSLLAALAVFIILFLRSNQKLIRYICRLNEEVQILEGGNLEYQVLVEGNDEITELARSMNRMRESFQQQMETEQRLHRANKKLITEMSHDLRTPLTGMMLYLEILRNHRYTTEAELQEYLEKIDAKAHHMKMISDHLFEYSLEKMPQKQAEPLGMKQAFAEPLHDFEQELQVRGFTVASELTWPPCFVQMKPEYLHRIMENILSNLQKYALPGSEIRIDALDSGTYCGFSVMNICSLEPIPEESNGIGMESIRTMMAQMDGSCIVEQTEEAFMITLLFPRK